MVKSLPAVQETQLSSLGLEDPLEKGMATHPGILAWRIPRTEELADYSPRIDRVTNTTAWERIGASLDPLSPSTRLVTFSLSWPFVALTWPIKKRRMQQRKWIMKKEDVILMKEIF